MITFRLSSAPIREPLQAAHLAQALGPSTPVRMCDDCAKLLASPSAQAHGNLRITDARKQPGGLSRGVLFKYQCGACRFAWVRVAESTSGGLLWLGGYAAESAVISPETDAAKNGPRGDFAPGENAESR